MRRLASTGPALLLFGLQLMSFSATARIVPPPTPGAAQRGGEALPAAAAQPGCRGAVGMNCAMTSPSNSAAWFMLPQTEALARLNASDRVALEAQRSVWRAPRVSARAFLSQRLLRAGQ
jgi:hypothetical protein